MQLSKFSMGIGDRFGRQGKAQLAAFVAAQQEGVLVTPVWNKSNREHQIVQSIPAAVRAEAFSAVKALRWTHSYHVDADHISLKTVDGFLSFSDYFTLDVADFTGKPAEGDQVEAMVSHCSKYIGNLRIPAIDRPLEITAATIRSVAVKYLRAVQEAGRIYRRIEAAKGKANFITEVSMDETDQAQSPVELLFILAALAHEQVPAQTIAPKFTGRFNKGVDYVGDVGRFTQEFNDDLAVIAYAVREFGLPPNLKLSVHSGSDKFSIYGAIRQAIRAHDAGLHLKTAGTTWLEELTGLALASPDGLAIARDIYTQAVERFDELCAPYATVIDIDRSRLPGPSTVAAWDGRRFAAAIRHDPLCPHYDRGFRQLIHVAYKVAAEMGQRYLDTLDQYASTVAPQVTDNIYSRHLRPLFVES